MTGVEDGVKELLFHGAYLGIKNCLGETAVERILPSTLEMFLDACVNGNSEEISSQNLAITFDYRILAPPQRSVTELGVVYSAASHSEHATQAVSLQPIGNLMLSINPESQSIGLLIYITTKAQRCRHIAIFRYTTHSLPKTGLF